MKPTLSWIALLILLVVIGLVGRYPCSEPPESRVAETGCDSPARAFVRGSAVMRGPGFLRA